MPTEGEDEYADECGRCKDDCPTVKNHDDGWLSISEDVKVRVRYCNLEEGCHIPIREKGVRGTTLASRLRSCQLGGTLRITLLPPRSFLACQLMIPAEDNNDNDIDQLMVLKCLRQY